MSWSRDGSKPPHVYETIRCDGCGIECEESRRQEGESMIGMQRKAIRAGWEVIDPGLPDGYILSPRSLHACPRPECGAAARLLPKAQRTKPGSPRNPVSGQGRRRR